MVAPQEKFSSEGRTDFTSERNQASWKFVLTQIGRYPQSNDGAWRLIAAGLVEQIDRPEMTQMIDVIRMYPDAPFCEPFIHDAHEKMRALYEKKGIVVPPISFSADVAMDIGYTQCYQALRCIDEVSRRYNPGLTLQPMVRDGWGIFGRLLTFPSRVFPEAVKARQEMLLGEPMFRQLVLAHIQGEAKPYEQDGPHQQVQAMIAYREKMKRRTGYREFP